MIRPIELVWNATTTHCGRMNALYRWRRWRLHTFTRFGAGHPVIYRLQDRRKFVAHPGDSLSALIAEQKAYEPLESRIVSEILTEGDAAIDIGANIGYYTSLCSNRVGPTGKVFAFEPGESTFTKLQATIDLLGLANVEAHRQAVADKCGVVSFVMSMAGSDAQQSLVDWEFLVGDKKLTSVESTTLDELLRELKQHGKVPAFIKCDVEGGEGKVLQGGGEVLESESPPVFLLEFNREALALQQSTISELTDKLKGYQLYFTPLMSGQNTMQLLVNAHEMPDFANVMAFPTRGAFAERIRRVTRYLQGGV